MRCLVSWILAVLAALAEPRAASGAAATPVVVCPSSLAAGQTHFCFVSGSVGVDDKVELVDGGSVVLEALPVPMSPGLYSLALPASLAPGAYTVRADVNGTAQTAEVQVVAEAVLVLLEADKAIYKPGQTALFRALVLTPSRLLPSANRTVQFAVVSPQGFKLLQAEAQTDASGVAGFEFPIATEPLLGPHAARATVVGGSGAGAVHEVAFSVEEYVLPRFEVNFTLDQTHVNAPSWRDSSSGTVSVTGYVAATYTHGEGVKGKAVVTVLVPLDPWASVSHMRVGFAMEDAPEVDHKEKPSDESGGSSSSGGAAYQVLASVDNLQLSADSGAAYELRIPRNRLSAGVDLVLEASVTDEATGEQQNATASLPVAYTGNELQVGLATADGAETFKPKLPTALKVTLQLPGGSPAGSKEITEGGPVRVVMQQRLVDGGLKTPEVVSVEVSEAAGGVAVVELPAVTEEARCCNPLARAVSEEEYKTKMGCCTSSVDIYLERGMAGNAERLWSSAEGMESSLCLSRAYSPSGNFLAVSPPTQAGSMATVRSTLDPALLNTSAEYLVLQGGTLVGGGRADLAAVSNPTGLAYFEASLPVQISDRAAGNCRLVVVTRTLDSGAAIAGSVDFVRELSWPFSLSASFSSGEVQPGADLTVDVEVSSVASGTPAHAFLASLDRSAELLGPRMAISKASALAGLGRAGSGAAAPTVAPRAWRECHLRGADMPVIAGEVGGQASVLAEAVQAGSAGSSKEEEQLDSPWGPSLDNGCPRPITGGCSWGWGGGMLMDEVEMAMGAPMERMDVDMDDGMAAMPGAVEESAAESTASKSSESGGATARAVAVRRFFPETWLWTDLALEAATGLGSLSVRAPDTITTWSLDAFVTTPDGIATARAAEPLRVFKPFFVEVRLPYSAVRGEELEVTVAVFNYVEGGGPVDATLVLTLPPELELKEGSATLQLTVPEGGAARTAFRVHPTAVGTFRLLATATAGDHADAIERALLVKPEGFPVTETRNVVLELSDASPTMSPSVELALPDDAVNGSARASLSVVGDLLGPTISGLERLLQIPTGCGEQNMITLAPNVYVAKYLKAIGRLRPDLRQRITRNMLIGYGRELTYRHRDGSFSAFGEQDESGSTWLTAFVLRTFAEVHASGLVSVDEGVLESAAMWLLSQQASDGSFRSRGKVIHQEMMGGLGNGGASSLALSAFVLSALAKARSEVPAMDVPGLSRALEQAGTFLEGSSASGTYVGLLRAHALLLAGLKPSAEAAEDVLALSSSSGDGGPKRRFWSAGSRTLDVELTGYGVLVLSLAQRLSEAFEGAGWLLERRSAAGGFASTQDTVVALGALATYAAAVAGNTQVLVTAKGTGFDHSFTVDESNVDVMQTQQLPLQAAGATIDLEATGSGVALAIAELSYNVRELPGEPCYNVEVQWFRPQDPAAELGGSVRASVEPREKCSERAKEGMWIVSVGLFTGYGASTSSLQQLRSEGAVKRYEVDDGRVEFYLEDLPEGQPTSVEFKVTRDFDVQGLQPAASKVYEYYAPEKSGSVLTEFEVKEYEPTPAPAPPQRSRESSSGVSSTAVSAGGLGLALLSVGLAATGAIPTGN